MPCRTCGRVDCGGLDKVEQRGDGEIGVPAAVGSSKISGGADDIYM